MLLLMATAGLWLTCSTRIQRFNNTPRAPMGRHAELPIPKSMPLPKQMRDDMARQPLHGCPGRTQDPRGDMKMSMLHWHGCTLHLLGGSETGIACRTAGRACQRAPAQCIAGAVAVFALPRPCITVRDCGLLCPWPGVSDGSSRCFL